MAYENKLLSEAEPFLLPQYKLVNEESFRKELLSEYDDEEENQKWQRFQSKGFLINSLALTLIMSWIGYCIVTSEWSREFTKELLSTPQFFNCHSQPDSEMENVKDVVNVMDLPSQYLPKTGANQERRRLVMIGDVHGMNKSLDHLLSKIKYNNTRDHLIFVGDLIAKGPSSTAVIDLAMKLGATCVRGNHEDMVIKAWDDIEAGNLLSDEDEDEDEDEGPAASSKPYDKKHRVLAQILGKERIEWIKSWPIILRVGEMGGMGEVVAVHAGLDAEVSLEDQDFYMVMNMRSIKHGVFTANHDGKAWYKKWNKHQKTLQQNKRQTIVYGHDAKRGLQVKSYSIGIDSGCVKGNKLTAAIFETDTYTYSYELVHVNC